MIVDLRTNHVVILRRGSACHRYILHQSSIARLKVGDTSSFTSLASRDIPLVIVFFFSCPISFLSFLIVCSIFRSVLLFFLFPFGFVKPFYINVCFSWYWTLNDRWLCETDEVTEKKGGRECKENRKYVYRDRKSVV